MPTPYVVGLTGGIASGKSTAAQFFTQLEIDLIDSDKIARQVVAPGSPGLLSIRQQFGPEVIQDNGELDRKAMGAIVFADPHARENLESIIHPLVWQEVSRQVSKCSSPYCLIDVPLLVETGRFDQYDRIVVVDVSKNTQRTRLKARDRRSDEEIDQILASQASREQRLAVAHDVLDNNGTKDQLSTQVHQLDLILRQRAAAHRT